MTRLLSILLLIGLLPACNDTSVSSNLAQRAIEEEDDDTGGGGQSVDLPPEFESLYTGFQAELVVGDLDMPVKLALAPDGRLFFNELDTGNIRVIDASGTLLPDPFATIAVVNGGERGLLGLALSPNFNSNGHVFVMACVDNPARQQVIRFTDNNNLGENMQVIVDNLPQGFIHNAGGLEFLNDGTLLVSVGDVNDTDLPQTDGELAGRLLRYNRNGGIPGNNPISGSPEWCRGLRNTFDLTVHPDTGGVFGVENGPATNDELNFYAAGKNYEWQTLPPSVPSSQVGLRLHAWHEVIAPTGITFHDGTGWGVEFADDLFVLGYVEAEILWLKMSGNFHTDLDEQVIFARLDNSGTANKPLDIVQSSDGSLYFSTFTAIWKISKVE